MLINSNKILLIVFSLTALLLFNACPEDFEAYITGGRYCNPIDALDSGDPELRTVNGKKTSDVYKSSDYPGFNPIIGFGKTITPKEREIIKLAVIQSKIIVNTDLFKKKLIDDRKGRNFNKNIFSGFDHPLQGSFAGYENGPNDPEGVYEYILKFREAKYYLTSYAKSDRKNKKGVAYMFPRGVTIIEKTDFVDVPSATGGYNKISINEMGYHLKCPWNLSFILLHEWMHVMNYDHGLVLSFDDVSDYVTMIAKGIHKEIDIPKIPEKCYKGTSTNYSC